MSPEFAPGEIIYTDQKAIGVNVRYRIIEESVHALRLSIILVFI